MLFLILVNLITKRNCAISSNRINKIFPGSTGVLVPGYKARLIKDDGTTANNNEIGELEINGPSSAISYWNKKEKTKNTFLKNWTRTGDKYTKNNEGVYTYCGRADDMMKVSGQYVSPFEVEAKIIRYRRASGFCVGCERWLLIFLRRSFPLQTGIYQSLLICLPSLSSFKF